VFRMRWRAPSAGALVVMLASGCASAPPAAPPVPVVSFEQKLGWIVVLEDRRILADPAMAPPPAPVAAVTPRRGAVTPVAPAYLAEPDLRVLARDPEGRVRRRASVAGRRH
jgi:hypothetical protein